MFFVTGLVATELVYTIAVASVGSQRLHRRAHHLRGVGDLGLLVGRDDRVDVLAVLVGEVTAQETGGAVRQSLHVVGCVGPQRGDRAGRRAGDIELRVDGRAVGQVGLQGCTREGGAGDEEDRGGSRGDEQSLTRGAVRNQNHVLRRLVGRPEPVPRAFRRFRRLGVSSVGSSACSATGSVPWWCVATCRPVCAAPVQPLRA